MDFNDTPDEAKFRAEARAWLEANAELKGADDAGGDVLGELVTEESVKAAKVWQKKKADAGWACITWPKEYGGRDATPIQNVIWRQEEAKFATPPPIFNIGIGMCGPTILTHGTEEQKKRWIPKMVSGEEVWCQLFSEPSAGSDLAGLRCSATRDGDNWLLNGQKTWTTGAHFCDWGVIVVRSDPSAVKHAGLTYFVVNMHAPGIEIRPITQINGGQAFNEVFFSDTPVPDDQRIDEVGNGWAVSITTLMNERASIGGSRAGAGLSELFDMALATQLEGKPAIEDPVVRDRLADFYIRSKGLQYTGYRTLTALSRGTTPGPEASLGKLVGAYLGQEMGSFAVELQGISGALDGPEHAAMEGVWQAMYLAMPGLRIAGGTDEILRNIIAERVLRLPPEARADKGIPFKDIPTGPPA
jgi:alkylation response protein AidB-like acyl-CoA dehydrogenase